MPSVSINWWAVLVAAVINMAVGAVWYSPMLFGKEWSKLIGKKMEDMRKNAGPGYAISTVGALIEAWVLAHFVIYAGSNTALRGVETAFWLWLAFVAVTLAIGSVFAGQSWRLWKINAGYFFVVLLVQGAVLAVWH